MIKNCYIFFSPSDALSLSLSGEFQIPTSIPTELIVDFLGKHKLKAMDLHEENKKYGNLFIIKTWLQYLLQVKWLSKKKKMLFFGIKSTLSLPAIYEPYTSA